VQSEAARGRSSGDARVLMLAIDAMSLPFTRAHLDQLPTLKALVEGGTLVEPESTGKYFSASSWPTFASTKSIGEHGQYFPFQWDAAHLKQRRLFDSAWRNEFVFEPFWYEFARAGISSTVLDIGFVQNDRAAPCRQVTNWSYQETAYADASDPRLLAEIRRRFGRRPIGREIPVPKSRALCLKIRDHMIRAIERKADAILWLMQRDEWRFFLAGFYELHRAGHNLWPISESFASQSDADSLLQVYQALDRQIQRIFDYARDEHTTVMVFALHGMAANMAQDHFLPKVMAKLNERYLAERGFGPGRTGHESLMSRLRKYVPYNLQYLTADILGERVQDWVVNRAVIGGHDWSRTPAFHVSSGGEGYLRLNIKGREARGFFEPDSAELQHYVDWLEAALLKIRVGRTDQPLVKRVLRSKDLFPGPKSHFLPDLVLKWAPAEPAEHIWSEEIGDVHERLRTGRGGNHAGGSFVMVGGPGASSRALHDLTHIKDIGMFARRCLEPIGRDFSRDALKVSQLAHAD
jgi:predicted AlkP superfamily phosphohydrolase/phosphomutase